MRGAAIGPGAALAAWLAVLVALNATADPLLCGAAFAALAWLAWTTGHRRLLVLSVVVGASLLLVVPGIALVDGSFRFAFAESRAPANAAEWLATVAVALRVPAQVLAATWLLLVPARLLLAGAARVSPDTALLGALTARLRPLLARDAGCVRDELASRGLRVERRAPIAERLRAVAALWESLVSGLLDRAFVTAAALHVRGWGVAERPTTAELRHPELRDEIVRDARTDAVMVMLAAGLAAGAVALRATGTLAAPQPSFIAIDPAPPGIAAMLLATCAVLLAVVPTMSRRHRSNQAAAPAGRAAPTTPRPATLHVRAATMHYPGAVRPAIDGIDLQVEPGELVVLVGPSGGGKSTLLDVVTGVAPHTSGGLRGGTIRLGDAIVDATRSRHDRHARIGAVFQYPEAQVLVGRVAEEVAFGLRHAGVDADALDGLVLDALDQLDIRHLARRDCATLSGGELQRVLLAAALVTRPGLLVLDEPTSQVDAATERRFWDAVDQVRRSRGIGVLVAEHRLDHLVDRADRIVVVDGGRVLGSHGPGDAARELAGMLADPYAGLAPADIDASCTRLAVHVERLHVGDDPATRRTLLRGLSLAAPARSIITLEGPNGTGKSTLLRTIRGLAPGGVVHVDGRPLGDVGGSADRIAWVSQGIGALLPGRTVEHAATETSRRLGRSLEPAHEALRAAALADRAADHPGELSVGQRQRLAIVAATSHRPPIWLLDEPTRGMDPASRRWVACHLLAHAAAGGVALVATHDPALAAAVATHRLRLDLRTGPTLLPVRRDRTGHASALEPWGTASPTSQELQP